MDSFEDLERQLGIDMSDPREALAADLVAADDELLEELVRLRKQSGMSKADVAAAIGRHRSVVTNFEKLTADPHLSTIRRYALAIGARISHHVEPVDLPKPASAASSDVVEVQSGGSSVGFSVAYAVHNVVTSMIGAEDARPATTPATVGINTTTMTVQVQIR
ncbi:helix-turn-helix transcriptional regulator [Nocardia sp. XZ_19_385]|uniref:helix-turn-helix domain-containing protein n=1 Tax=Nocardia sp. XZ_19_385 TaxID=2769488 RepID=UPI00188FD672|nr:helix-turn-helix transcriptional regulator [Nocardia sp. XZ_19_385]